MRNRLGSKLPMFIRWILIISSAVSFIWGMVYLFDPVSCNRDITSIVFFMLAITLALLAWSVDLEKE